jgi:cell division transport system ATP-binding protein
MVRFVEVTKVFPNGYIGLEGVSFEVTPGELLYITGESGAGKTTIMRLLIRELAPTEGEIFFGEDSLFDLPARNIPYHRRRIGVVFQDYQLIPDRTIFENASLILEIMGLPATQIRQRVTDVLELVGIEDKALLFPVQLSGGELQRAAIARSLVTAPEILFADEPTGNLDAETGISIMGLLKKIQEMGTTVMIATHDPKVMKKFPARHIRLKQGKLIEDSARPEVAKQAKQETVAKASVVEDQTEAEDMKVKEK